MANEAVSELNTRLSSIDNISITVTVNAAAMCSSWTSDGIKQTEEDHKIRTKRLLMGFTAANTAVGKQSLYLQCSWTYQACFHSLMSF